MDLNKINSLCQKANKYFKIISDVNAVDQALKGNTRPAKRKINNKIKNKGFNFLKKLL